MKKKIKHKQKNFIQRNNLTYKKIAFTIIGTTVLFFSLYQILIVQRVEQRTRRTDEHNQKIYDDYARTITRVPTPEEGGGATPSNVRTIEDAMRYYCKNTIYSNGSIPLSKLPFSLSEELKSFFHVSNSASCSKEHDYIQLETYDQKTSAKFTDYQLLFFPFDKNVPYFFNEEENGSNITLNGQTYRLQFTIPDGGYQVTKDGVWITLYKEYVDRASNTRVRSGRYAILKDKEIIDYYTSHSNSYKGDPNDLFHSFAISVVSVLMTNNKIHSEFLEWGNQIQENLNGVTFDN